MASIRQIWFVRLSFTQHSWNLVVLSDKWMLFYNGAGQWARVNHAAVVLGFTKSVCVLSPDFFFVFRPASVFMGPRWSRPAVQCGYGIWIFAHRSTHAQCSAQTRVQCAACRLRPFLPTLARYHDRRCVVFLFILSCALCLETHVQKICNSEEKTKSGLLALKVLNAHKNARLS